MTMTSNQFKNEYYLKCSYHEVSKIEFKCRIVAYKKLDDSEFSGLESKINYHEIGQIINDSIYYSNQITWPSYLGQTITMLFYSLMSTFNISDINTVDGQDSIKCFFDSNPFDIK